MVYVLLSQLTVREIAPSSGFLQYYALWALYEYYVMYFQYLEQISKYFPLEDLQKKLKLNSIKKD